MTQYIYFVTDTRFHHYQYRTESLYYHLLNNEYCNIVPIKLPFSLKHEIINSPIVYEFFIDDGGEHCINNKFSMKAILNDNRAIVIVNTLFEDYEYIKIIYNKILKKYPELQGRLYLHSKSFFINDSELPIISTTTISNKPIDTNNNHSTLVGLSGNSSNLTCLATKALSNYYQIITDIACDNSLYDSELNTPLKWKYHESWWHEEKGFVNFVMKNVPFNKTNLAKNFRYELYCNEIKSQTHSDISLSEISNPSIWINSNVKTNITNKEGFHNCSVQLRPLPKCDNEVKSFREEFRQLRILHSLKDNEYTHLYEELKHNAQENIVKLKNNQGFLSKKTLSLIHKLTTNKKIDFDTIHGLSHQNIACIDFNSDNKKHLTIFQETSTFEYNNFKASIPSIRILTIDFENEQKFIESIANYRKNIPSNQIIYFHGSFSDSPRIINTILSLSKNGNIIYSNQYIKQPQIQKITSNTKINTIYNLIEKCQMPRNSTANNILLDTNIPDESSLTETNIVNKLKRKDRWLVPISDITNGIGISRYLENYDINYIPIFCGFIKNNKMINHNAYINAKNKFGSKLELHALDGDQFLLQVAKLYPFAYTFYDACIFWMLDNIPNNNFIVSLDNYKRLLSYHNLSLKRKTQDIYQHQFPTSETRLKDYDDISITLHYETQLIEEIYAKFYRKY